MAKQKGIIKLKGTIGDISFYKTIDGHLAREKGGVDATRIKNDPNFQRTRENGQEFGHAGSAGKLLRTAFRIFLQNASDTRMVSRLTKDMMAVIKADATSTRGQRNVLDGELEMLEGFEFNIDGKLTECMYAPYTATINRVSGEARIVAPTFEPSTRIAYPVGGTHLKFVAGGAEIDFENGTFHLVNSETGHFAIAPGSTANVDLNNVLTPNSTKPIFLIFGIEFFQDVNGQRYPLKNGLYNPLALVKVSGL